VATAPLAVASVSASGGWPWCGRRVHGGGGHPGAPDGHPRQRGGGHGAPAWPPARHSWPPGRIGVAIPGHGDRPWPRGRPFTGHRPCRHRIGAPGGHVSGGPGDGDRRWPRRVRPRGAVECGAGARGSRGRRCRLLARSIRCVWDYRSRRCVSAALLTARVERRDGGSVPLPVGGDPAWCDRGV